MSAFGDQAETAQTIRRSANEPEAEVERTNLLRRSRDASRFAPYNLLVALISHSEQDGREPDVGSVAIGGCTLFAESLTP